MLIIKGPLNGILFFLLLSFPAISAYAVPERVSILVRTTVAVPEVAFSNAAKEWIRNQKTLRLAIWGQSHPPIFMGYDRQAYEGIGADYASVISQALSIPVEVFSFNTFSEAYGSLMRGKIDVLAFYNPLLQPIDKLLFSQPYLLDHAVIVHKNSLSTDSIASLKQMKLVYSGDSYLASLLKDNFPHAYLTAYQYFSEAMASIAYGASDAFWLNASTARFLLNQGIETQAKVSLTDLPANVNISFAVHNSNYALLEAIDAVLNALPLETRLRIVNNWGLDASFAIKQNPLVLPKDELAWISKHPEITTQLPGKLAPLSFLTAEGISSGYVLSLLQLISERTGLKFRLESALTNSVEMPENTLIAAMIKMPGTYNNLRFTRTFTISPWVMVSNSKTGDRTTLEQMDGRRVVVIRGSGIIDQLKNQYPRIRFIETDTDVDALKRVANKQADVAISVQIAADYLINKHFYKKLIIVNAVNLPPAHFAMAVHANNPQLLSILNKALAQISPQSLQRELLPWQNYQAPSKVTVWDRHSRQVLLLGALILGGLIFYWIRNRFLKKVLAERRSYEHQLEDQLYFIRTLIDDSPVAMYVRDSQSQMLQCNRTYLQFMQTDIGTVIGKTLKQADIIHSATVASFQNIYNHTLKDALPQFSRQKIVTAHGHEALVYHWSLPYRDHSGEVSGIIGGFIDITEQEQLLAELQQAKHSAEKANASKSIFLAQMSHEIRTPLNALIGLLELEYRKITTAEQRDENIAAAWHASQSLLSLVGNILDMAKIESGVHQVTYAPVSLPDTINTLITLFKPAAEEKKLTLKSSFELTESVIMFDQTLFNQIVSNLLSNAIKFTPSGLIEIALYQGESKGEFRQYVLEVCDTGVGLNSGQQQAIFEPFVQIETHGHIGQGTGLGLSISRQLVNRLGGTLTVESEPGNGSTFIFNFMAKPCAAQPQLASINCNKEMAPLKILIIDDHAPNRLLLTQQLGFAGHLTVAVESGEQALICWDQTQPPFDVVISDCNMPGMNGFDLIAALREKEKHAGLHARPMFGLTAMAEQSVIERSERCGMTECLFKPLPLDKLLTHLKQHYSTMNVKGNSAASPSKPEGLNPFSHFSSAAWEDLICTMIESNNNDFIALHAAVENEDMYSVKHYAHRLKGCSRIIKSERLLDICVQFESAANLRSQQHLRILINVCKEEIDAISKTLQKSRERDNSDT